MGLDLRFVLGDVSFVVDRHEWSVPPPVPSSGGDPLYESMSVVYWWPDMSRDCHDFANACTVCAGVRSSNLTKAEIRPVATPSRPFQVVHVDHKGPLPKCGGDVGHYHNNERPQA